MATFLGYLFAAMNSNGTVGQHFPNEYIAYDTWDTNPNQREEIKAYRDDNTRNLTRITAQGKKSTFKFDTRENLHLADIEAIKSFFDSCMQDANQRRVWLQYWNMEELTYKTGMFYIPNASFKIKKITNNDIIFDVHTFDLIEY